VFNYTFQWRAMLQYVPDLLAGALITLELAVASILVGSVLGVLLALAKDSRSIVLKAAAVSWIEIARNTPALFQIYFLYFGLGSLGIFVDSYPALLGGIIFNNAGYLAETFRGGLRGIPHTQMRAARSLGMTQIQAFVLIILPQLFRIVFNPLTNQFVWAILMTSLGIVVGVDSDLIGVTQALNVKTYRTLELFTFAAILYYLLSRSVTLLARIIGRRMFAY
jgi:hydroxyproline transport system permease protein